MSFCVLLLDTAVPPVFEELTRLIVTSYENDAQTLTTDTEGNL